MRYLMILLAGALLLSAQDEPTLRRAFEGQTVVVKVDMPAYRDGVDVYPDASMPVDFRKVASRLKEYGTGVHQGESIMVTKVVVKKDHIEFQLGGGGFGTLSDRLTVAAAASTVPYQYKSDREHDLEQQLKYETNSRERRRLQEQLDDIREDRRQDNQYATVANNQARQMQQQKVKELESQGGSRFNIWYKDGLPQEAKTPEGIMRALAKYVEFSDGPSSGSRATEPWPDSPQTSSSGNAPTNDHAKPTGSGLGAVHKGMTIGQVERILGPATKVGQHSEGSVDVSTREYETEDGLAIRADFAGGVLIDFSAKAK